MERIETLDGAFIDLWDETNETEGNAAFIVLACNAHDALTADNARLRKALTRLVNAYQDEITRANNDVPLTSAALYQARAALAGKDGSQ